MRHRLLACLLTTLPALASCAAEDAPPEPELGAEEAEEAEATSPLLVTVRASQDYATCVSTADTFDGIDIAVELPRLLKFVTTSALKPADVARSLFLLTCVQTVEVDRFTEPPEEMCVDFGNAYCNKAAECLTPAELAERGWTDPAACIQQMQGQVCQLISFCKFVDLAEGPACVADVTAGSCELFREALNSTPLAYPACADVCVL